MAGKKHAGFCTQFGLLLKKNATIKLRNWKSLCWEIFIPILFCCLLLLVRNAVEVETIEENLHLESTTSIKSFGAVSELTQALACGSKNKDGDYETSPGSFGVAIGNSTIQDGIALRVRTMFTGLASAANVTFVKCEQQPVACRFTVNAKKAACKGPFPTRFVNITDMIASDTFVQKFESRGKLEAYVTSGGYASSPATPPVLYAVSFASPLGYTGNNKWSYIIHGNRSEIPSERGEVGGLTNDLQAGFDERVWKSFITTGFMLFQAAVDSYVVHPSPAGALTLANWLTSSQFVPFPVPTHDKDLFAEYMGQIIGLVFVMAYFWPFSRLVRGIVAEKEAQIKETMRMMGASNNAFWLSWAVTYVVIFSFLALLTTLLLQPVFSYSSFGAIFALFLFHNLAMIAVACCLGVIFQTSKMAGLLSVAVYFGLYMPINAISATSTAGIRTIFSLFPPTALAMGLQKVLTYESAFVGITSENIQNADDGLAVSRYIGLLFFDIILYSLLAWYLDNVWTQKYGTSKRCCFCCFCCCKRPSRSANKVNSKRDVDLELDNDKVQQVSAELADKCAITINDMRKVFTVKGKKDKCRKTGEHAAVKGLSLKMYEGQIFVLLGHNGAGKTTTINMMTGLLPITTGSATVCGFDVETQMDQIHKILGVCPQINVLFPDLTVAEHLRMYGRIKGVSEADLEAKVAASIAEIQMERQATQKSDTLSGGQKRRLSLAIALIGDSKIIFLDEPTSGVDPFSRRAIWDLLQAKKAGRVIILTTHFMDEADQLGDRIAIMHHGQLRCCGTSMFLKKKFGVGYNMVITRDEKSDPEALSQMITKHVENSELLSNVGTELSFRLPLGHADRFPAMLRELEDRGKELGCLSFGMGITTLEEVFLKVASEQEDVAEQKEMKQMVKRLSTTERKEKEKFDILEGKDVSTARHIRALLSKRFHNAKRDRKFVCCQLILPVCILVFGLMLFNSVPFPIDAEDISLNFNELNQPLRTPVNSQWNGSAVGLEASFGKVNGVDFEPWNSDFASLANFSTELLDRRDEFKQSRYGAYCEGPTGAIAEFQIPNAKMFTKNYTRPIPPAVQYNLFTNITARYGIPMFWSLFSQMKLRETATSDENATITVTISRMPATATEREFFDIIKGFQTAIIVTIATSFLPVAYVVFVVNERNINSKHLQMISGVNIPAYWFSNYLFDYCCFTIVTVFFLGAIQILGNDSYTGEALPVLIVSMLLWGLAVLPFTYLFSFVFKDTSTAQNMMILIFFMTGVVMLVVVFVLNTLDDIDMATVDAIRFIFRLFPNFCFSDTFSQVGTLRFRNQFAIGENIGPWDMEVSGYNCVFLLMEAIIYFALVLVIEYYNAGQGCLRAPENKSLQTKGLDTVEDEDVEAEKQRILDGGASEDLIRLEGLRKVYPQKVAVNDLYFGIPKNQCFGFLGVNGAGKSTTLKMLTGDETPTKGTAFLGNHSIIKEPIAVRRMMGYCPQFDAIHPLMTGEETLIFYARIRGVPEDKINEMVATLSERLTLTQDNQHKRPAGTYSGGNKRKLSVGIALIGNPKVVFLDEPSTGMDPVSRRFMWDFISQTMVDRAVILTTHSMEECEALCSRIGILVHGRLKCIGSSQHLKDRFGSGFEFLLSIKDGFVDQARAFVQSTFTESEEVECYGGNMKYRLGKQAMKLSEIFSLIETKREELGIIDYSIGQTTLEQIFISFASAGDKELEAEEAMEAAKGGSFHDIGSKGSMKQSALSAPLVSEEREATERKSNATERKSNA